MRGKRKKTAIGAVIMYLLLVGGLWMFINSYANSFNRLTEEKLLPASLTVTAERASVQVLDRKADIDLRLLRADSRLYYAAYLLSPDEIRSAAFLISFWHGS